jgi:hypothetical protein
VQSSLAARRAQSTGRPPALLRVLKFIDEGLQLLAKKTNSLRTPMKDTQVQWLDSFKQILLMIVQQLHLSLGSIG